MHMAKKMLKDVRTQAKAASTKPRLSATELRRVANEAGRSLHPATVRHEARTVLIYFKVSEDLTIALAKHARAEGITQKQLFTRWVAPAGRPMDDRVLEDRSPRRRVAA